MEHEHRLLLNGYIIDYISNNGIAGIAIVNSTSPNKAASILALLGAFSTVGYKIKTISQVYFDKCILKREIDKVVGEVTASRGERGTIG